MIKRIHVTYHLDLDAGADSSKIDRAYALHAERCPVYRSLHPQIDITTALQTSEIESG